MGLHRRGTYWTILIRNVFDVRVGAWRSLVARLLREQEVGGSNPLAPTTIPFRITYLMMKHIVGVVGAGDCDERTARVAEEVGERLAREGLVVLTGGRGGVMAAASRGAKKVGGLTVGVLPGNTREEANCYVDIPILTGIGEARNAIVACASEVLVAIAGEYGTLSEIALALKMGRPVIGLQSWPLVAAVMTVDNPEQAVEKVLNSLEMR